MATVSYVLNKRSGVLHKLPASESCNTDQIVREQRFEIHTSEQMMSYVDEAVKVRHFRRCIRCFPESSERFNHAD